MGDLVDEISLDGQYMHIIIPSIVYHYSFMTYDSRLERVPPVKSSGLASAHAAPHAS